MTQKETASTVVHGLRSAELPRAVDCVSSGETHPPKDLSTLKHLIASGKTALPKQLGKIARFALENPVEMAMTNARGVARLSGVSPSSVSRFAVTLGFAGYAELRRFFQQDLRGRGTAE